MQNIAEIQIVRYKKGTHPHYNGEVLSSYIVDRNEEDIKLKAVQRLKSFISKKDTNSFEYTQGDTFNILKIKTDGAFNDPGEIVFSKQFTDNHIWHKKALRRFAKYLSKIDNNFIYFPSTPLREKGENIYIISTRYTKILDEKDKLKQWKKQISAKKAAITRSKNKAKNIREEYKATLFPNAYKDNKRYKSLVKYLYVQKNRLHEFLHVGLENIETIVGGYHPSSVFKVGAK